MENINANTVVVNDLGEFITILGSMRVRKELIAAYFTPEKPIDKDGDVYSVNVMMQHGWNAAGVGTKDECEKEIRRLDWIYKNANKTI